MSKKIVLNDDIITAEAIEKGDLSGMILCTKGSEVAGIITYSNNFEQWKFVSDIYFDGCLADRTLTGLLHLLFNDLIIDKAVFE